MGSARTPKKAPEKQFEVEVVDVPIPKGSDERHLYEMKFCFTAPAGYSMDDVYRATLVWLLRGGEKKLEVLAEYGGGLKNKTLTDPRTRDGFVGGGRMYCTAFDNESIPKTATAIKVMRVKGTVEPSPIAPKIEPKPARMGKGAKRVSRR